MNPYETPRVKALLASPMPHPPRARRALDDIGPLLEATPLPRRVRFDADVPMRDGEGAKSSGTPALPGRREKPERCKTDVTLRIEELARDKLAAPFVAVDRPHRDN